MRGENSIAFFLRSLLCALLAFFILAPYMPAYAIGGSGISPDGRDPSAVIYPQVTPRVPVSYGESAMPKTSDKELEPAAKIIAEFLRAELKLNSAAVSGILANIERESKFDPETVGDSGAAFGLCQWRDGRRDRLLGYCEAYSLDVTTISAQLNFLKAELINYYPDTLMALEGVKNNSAGADIAAYAFCKYYETPTQLYSESQTRRSLARYDYYPLVSKYENQELPTSQIEAELMTADFLKNELKFNNAVTAGILANIMDESAFNPKALGDKGRAYGLCQWTSDRRENLQLFCIRNNLEADSLYAQLNFIKYELEGSHRTVAEELRKCTDDENGAKQAVKIFCAGYEVPRYLSAALVQRYRYAENVYYPMLKTPLETTEFLSSMAARAADRLKALKKGSLCPESLEDKLLSGEDIKIY